MHRIAKVICVVQKLHSGNIVPQLDRSSQGHRLGAARTASSKLDGGAQRVPTITGSLTELTVCWARP